jgi:hypothetical protein
MPSDALWVQASGVSYSDIEDRKLIHAIFADGRVEGLELSVGAGLDVRVAPGSAVIRDATHTGSYLAVLDSATSRPIPANSANVALYLTVDPVTAEVAVAAGPSVPTLPFYVLGGATSGASTVAAASHANRVLSDFTPAIGRYLKRAGDTITGPISLDGGGSISRPGAFLLDGNGIQAQQGIRIGNAAVPTKRYMSRHERTTSQNIPSGTWHAVDLDDLWARGFNDYSPSNADTFSGATWTVPVSGWYHLTGRAFWEDIGGATANGSRQSSIAILNPGGAVSRRFYGEYFQDTTLSGITFAGATYPARQVTRNFLDQRMIWWEAGLDLVAGQMVQLHVAQSQGKTITVAAGASATLRLLQAD